MDPVAREKKGFAQRVGYDTQKATAPRKSTVSAQGARAQRSEALGRSGTWKQAAKHVAGAHACHSPYDDMPGGQDERVKKVRKMRQMSAKGKASSRPAPS